MMQKCSVILKDMLGRHPVNLLIHKRYNSGGVNLSIKMFIQMKLKITILSFDAHENHADVITF